MTRLYQLVEQYRNAIDSSLEAGVFEKDIVFKSFPHGCCGDTCYLLAEFLRNNGIDTVYVCGRCRDQSHAWIVLKDDRVKMPQRNFFTVPEEINDILRQYGANTQPDRIYDVTHYVETDVGEGILIDITADQFGESPVYVGVADSFHEKFEFDFAHDICNLEDARLISLYRKIFQYI